MKASFLKIAALTVITPFCLNLARGQSSREVYQGTYYGNSCEVTLMWADASGMGGVVGKIQTGNGAEITFIGQSPRVGYLEIDLQGQVEALHRQIDGNAISWGGTLLTFNRVEAAPVPPVGVLEKRYEGAFRGNACTVTLQWTTQGEFVDVSGALTMPSGAVLRIHGAETRPGFLEITVETDESINHKLSLSDAGGRSAWVGDYLSFTETAGPGITPLGAGGQTTPAMPTPGISSLPPLPPLGGGLPPMPQLPGPGGAAPTGAAPTGAAPGTTALTPSGGGLPPLPPLPAAGGLPPLGGGLPPMPQLPSTGVATVPPSPGGLNHAVPPGGGLAMPTGPAEDLYLTPEVWPVGRWPEGMAHDGNFLWVAESGQRTLAHINPDTGAIAERVNSGRLPVGMATNPVTGDVFAEVATDQTLVKFSRGAKGGKFASVPDYPSGIAADDTAVWVLMWIGGSNDQGQVIRYDQGSGSSSKSELLGDAVSNIGKAGNGLWVNQAKLDTTHINLLDPNTVHRKQTITLHGFFPSLVANESSVFVGGGNWDVDGMVVRVDPMTLQETARRPLPGEFVYRMTANDEFLVAAGAGGTLWILDSDDLTLRRTIHLDWRPFQPASLLIDGENLYITTSEGDGENGSILVVEGWAPAGHP